MIANVDELMLAHLVESGVPSSALENALRPIIAKKTEIAQFERRVQALETERMTIVDDQQRLRENMKALRGSAEEKQLLQRYTRQLDEEENKLDALKQDLTKMSQQLVSLRGELAALIGSVSFDLTAAPQTPAK
jgi:chromosome segregation ATPase